MAKFSSYFTHFHVKICIILFLAKVESSEKSLFATVNECLLHCAVDSDCFDAIQFKKVIWDFVKKKIEVFVTKLFIS